MSLFGKSNKNSEEMQNNVEKTKPESEFKYFVEIDHLSSVAVKSFIDGVVSNSMNDESGKPYIVEYDYINQFTILSYLDYAKYKEFIDNETDLYDVAQDILCQIDMVQYQFMLDKIDEGIQYELQLKFNQSSIEQKLNDLLDKIIKFTENLPEEVGELTDLVKGQDKEKVEQMFKLGYQTDAINNAQEKVKKERKAKKAQQKVVDIEPTK